MALVRVMYWKGIPYAVRATEGTERASRQLPQEFQEAVDAAAMASGETSQEDYQAGFVWGAPEERPGAPAEIADRVVAEIIAAYPKEILNVMARAGGRKA